MDLEVLTFIVGLILYFLFQALSNKKRKAQRQPAPDAPQQARQNPQELQDLSLEDALREIREALGTATQPPAPQPAPEPEQEVAETFPVPTDPDWTVRSQPRFEDRRLPKMSPEPEFQPVSADHREAHFLADLEPSDASSVPDLNVDDLDLSRPTRTAQRADLRRRLREPGTAREAVLFNEILQPPRVLRSQRRP